MRPKTPNGNLVLHAQLFHGFSDCSRLSIVEALRAGERRVSDVVEATGLTQPNVSMHLACLWECGLVAREKRGREVHYRLLDGVAELLAAADAVLARGGGDDRRLPTLRKRKGRGGLSEEHQHEDLHDDEHGAPPRLSWREASYRFPPLRNALAAGLLLLAGLIVEWSGGPEAGALPLFLLAIGIGAWYFAREAVDELLLPDARRPERGRSNNSDAIGQGPRAAPAAGFPMELRLGGAVITEKHLPGPLAGRRAPRF